MRLANTNMICMSISIQQLFKKLTKRKNYTHTITSHTNNKPNFRTHLINLQQISTKNSTKIWCEPNQNAQMKSGIRLTKQELTTSKRTRHSNHKRHRNSKNPQQDIIQRMLIMIVLQSKNHCNKKKKPITTQSKSSTKKSPNFQLNKIPKLNLSTE